MSNIYQSSSGQWIYFDGATKRYFDTQMEAQQMASKQQFVNEMKEVSTLLAQASDRLDNLFTVYFDRGYGGGGADPIVDGDTDTPPATVAAGITLAENFRKFLDGGTGDDAPFVSDYDSTLNKLRTDV